MNDSSLERAFDSIDTNQNSVIDAEELLATLKRLGITAVTLEEAERMLSQTDVDRAGLLSKREFLSVMDPLSEDPVIVKKRDDLARRAGQLLQRFNDMREFSRNGLWASVVLTLVATLVHSLQQYGMQVYSVVMSLILLIGAAAVPYTVREFRKLYRPVLVAYRLESEKR